MKGVRLDELIAAGATVGPPVRLPDLVPPRAVAAAALQSHWDLADSLRYLLKLHELGGAAHLAGWEPEHEFAPPRKWRFDVAWPGPRVAVECDGGLYLPGGGGHNRPADFVKDLQKRNEAQLRGWLVLVVTGGMIQSGEAQTLIERALAARKGTRGTTDPTEPDGQPDPSLHVPGADAAAPPAEAETGPADAAGPAAVVGDRRPGPGRGDRADAGRGPPLPGPDPE